MNRHLSGAASVAFFIASLCLGGASAAGIHANAAIQISAALILIVIAVRWKRQPIPTSGHALLWLAVAMIFVVAIQLVPLPAEVWVKLPGREAVASGFDLLAYARPPLPLSLAPDATITSALSLLAPLAMLLLLWRARETSSNLWPLVIGVSVVASVLFGVVQRSGGRTSPLYFYENTNWGSMVGFFANANHQATLLLMALPFFAYLAAEVLRRRGDRAEKVAKLLALVAMSAILAGCILANASRAGLALLLVTLGLCACMLRMELSGRLPRAWLIAFGLMTFTGLGALAISGRLVDAPVASQAGVPGTTRQAMWQNTGDLISATAPVGTGLGSFVELYRTTENPRATTRIFVNHVHNDYLEWFLEMGVLGALLVLAFFAWWTGRVRAVWSDLGTPLGRAASIASSAVILHSVVDYPIRTAAIAVFFALCCALMAQPGDPPRTAAIKNRSAKRSR